MNILFFLTPKCEVAYIYEDETLRQALEKMEYHKYSAVPIISRTGRYIGTITEGDMLWGIKNKFNLSLKEAERVTVAAIDRRLDNRPVYANSNMEDLIDKALNQNFVPVVDDQKNFIGIITRKDTVKGRFNRIICGRVEKTRQERDADHVKICKRAKNATKKDNNCQQDEAYF